MRGGPRISSSIPANGIDMIPPSRAARTLASRAHATTQLKPAAQTTQRAEHERPDVCTSRKPTARQRSVPQ